jgi:multiple sugar transport system substrate-binding protein
MKRSSLTLTITASMLILAACAQAPVVTAPPAPTSAPAAVATEKPAEPAAPTEAPAAAGAKFRIWKTFQDGDDILKGLMEPWAKENNVEFELTSGMDAAKILAAITGGDPPDLLIQGGPDNAGTWAREKLLTPLDDVITANNMSVDEIFPGPLATCRYFGKLYCLPWGTDIYALYWNKALFKEAGLDPEKPPQTLEELDQYAEKLTKVDADGNITQLGFLPDFSWSHLGDAYAMLFGASPVNQDGTQITFNSPEFIQAMEWQRKFYNKLGFDKIDKFKQGFGEYSSPQNGFYSGKLGMMIEGEWQPNFIKSAGVNLDYGVAPAPYPAANPERKNTASVAGTIMSIPTGVKNPDLSAKALAYLQGPKPLADFMVNNKNLPTTKAAAQDPRFREDAKFAVFMDLLASPNAKSHTLTPISSEIGAAISEAEEKSFRDPSFDIKAFLDEKAKELQPQLDKVNAQ